MTQLLGLILLAFFITSLTLVPFIDFLFFLKRKLEKKILDKKKSETPIHDMLMKGDESTPSGGGILLILVLTIITIVYAFVNPSLDRTNLKILLLALLSFGGLGFADDIRWIITRRKGKLLGLGRKKLMVVQVTLSTIIAMMLFSLAGLNNIYIPYLGNQAVGFWYIPLAALIIVAFANAYNISDGLDGLSAGLLLICLFAFLAVASQTLNLSLAAFIGIWIGTLLSFLYFNVYPARIFLGDAGAFGFGATLAVVGLLTGKILALAIIGGMFVIIVLSSLMQIFSKRFFNRKILAVAPIHMYFRYIGWEEPKIVVRFWLAQSLFAIFGLWIAFSLR